MINPLSASTGEVPDTRTPTTNFFGKKEMERDAENAKDIKSINKSNNINQQAKRPSISLDDDHMMNPVPADLPTEKDIIISIEQSQLLYTENSADSLDDLLSSFAQEPEIKRSPSSNSTTINNKQRLTRSFEKKAEESEVSVGQFLRELPFEKKEIEKVEKEEPDKQKSRERSKSVKKERQKEKEAEKEAEKDRRKKEKEREKEEKDRKDKGKKKEKVHSHTHTLTHSHTHTLTHSHTHTLTHSHTHTLTHSHTHTLTHTHTHTLTHTHTHTHTHSHTHTLTHTHTHTLTHVLLYRRKKRTRPLNSPRASDPRIR